MAAALQERDLLIGKLDEGYADVALEARIIPCIVAAQAALHGTDAASREKAVMTGGAAAAEAEAGEAESRAGTAR